MTGKIEKGIGGFYYVNVSGYIYECKAKGVFRNRKIKPLVGDDCEIEIIDEEKKIGNIISILPRRNELIRPAAANCSQAIIIFAVTSPAPNLNLLDRFLISMERQDIETIICFNKMDLAPEEANRLKKIYDKTVYHTILASTKTGEGIEEIRELLKGKTTILAGPSGVGKSSIVNTVCPDFEAKTGGISEKVQRGKHTTRHSELIAIDEESFIMDTPGFSSLYVEGMEEEELRQFFPEMIAFEGMCRFNGCIHVNEPNCMVKEKVAEGVIARERYDTYLQLYEEIHDKKKW